MRNMVKKIAILYQAQPAPAVNGIVKPMKKGGYQDSSADIGYALSKKSEHWKVVTPIPTADPKQDNHWSFPDTEAGIKQAIENGAEVVWANTVLYKDHPIQSVCAQYKIGVVGQHPDYVQIYDDKCYTNLLLAKHKLQLPLSFLISSLSQQKQLDNAEDQLLVSLTPNIFELANMSESKISELNITFPIVGKPIRGRGSQGVEKLEDYNAVVSYAKRMFDSGEYGTMLMFEEFLSGDEFTVAVFPPGKYLIKGEWVEKPHYWAAPPVQRVAHQNGIAPYNGVVAVTQNSFVWKGSNKEIDLMLQQCEKAAEIVQAKAPIRIDCRFNNKSKHALFDLNMKPNMTGAGRPARDDQDSLVGIAVSEIGWDYPTLVDNIANSHWFF